MARFFYLQDWKCKCEWKFDILVFSNFWEERIFCKIEFYMCESVFVYVSVILVFNNFGKIDFFARLNFVCVSVCVSISVLVYVSFVCF